MPSQREKQSNSKILSLQPQINKNEILHSSEGLEDADYLNYDVDYPIILLKRDWVTKLNLPHCHDKEHHFAGINNAVAQLS